MTTQVATNLWIYFLKIENNDDRVICKLCKKNLNANRNYNLKQHLKQSHKLQFHTEKKQKRQKLPPGARKERKDQKPVIARKRSSLSGDNGDNFYELNAEELISNCSVSKDSIDPSNIKPLDIEANDVIDTAENEAAFEIVTNYEAEQFDNIETITATTTNKSLPLPGTKSDSFAVFSVNSKKNRPNFSDPLNETDPIRRNDNIKPHCKKNKKIELADDPLDESESPCKEFDKWAHQKEKLMDLEYTEMRNYKLKLEIWEKEQQLRLVSSKYTRDIRSNL